MWSGRQKRDFRKSTPSYWSIKASNQRKNFKLIRKSSYYGISCRGFDKKPLDEKLRNSSWRMPFEWVFMKQSRSEICSILSEFNICFCDAFVTFYNPYGLCYGKFGTLNANRSDQRCLWWILKHWGQHFNFYSFFWSHLTEEKEISCQIDHLIPWIFCGPLGSHSSVQLQPHESSIEYTTIIVSYMIGGSNDLRWIERNAEIQAEKSRSLQLWNEQELSSCFKDKQEISFDHIWAFLFTFGCKLFDFEIHSSLNW